MSGNDDTFPVRSCPGYGFYAGRLPPNRQVLVTKCAYGFIAVYEFDEGGAFLNKTRIDLPPSMLRPDGLMPGFYKVDEDEFQTFLQCEVGLTLGAIRVKEFHFPEDYVEVYRLPKGYQEFLADPNGPDFDDELRGCLPDQIEAWLAAGRFVLVCGNDYWLNSDGDVTDS